MFGPGNVSLIVLFNFVGELDVDVLFLEIRMFGPDPFDDVLSNGFDVRLVSRSAIFEERALGAWAGSSVETYNEESVSA